MQFKIVFHVKHPGQLMPLSYQYELSSWLYRLIGSANSDFGEFLHSRGYVSGKKRFKLFTFSQLHVPTYEILGDRMKVLSREVSFVVSFLVERAAQELILGLFHHQSLRLGDKISQIDLAVQSVYSLPAPDLAADRVRLRATSPILVSEPEERGDGRLTHNYLHPHDEAYAHFFFQNLLDKYDSARRHQLVEAVDTTQPMQLDILTPEPKRRGIRIKAFTPQETKIIGYVYDFELQAPRELLRVGMLAGFGGENALGFGGTKILNQVIP